MLGDEPAPNVTQRLTSDRLQLPQKREVPNATVGFQDKIAHLDEAVAREPTRKKTHALDWLPTRAGVRIDVDLTSGDSQDLESEDSHDRRHGLEKHHLIDDSDYDNNNSDEAPTRRRAKFLQSGVTDFSGTLHRIRAKHPKRRGTFSRRVKHYWKKVGPALRLILIWAYISALIWSCDAVVDVDFSILDVLLRAIPAYIFTCAGFAVIFTSNHRTAAALVRFYHRYRKSSPARKRRRIDVSEVPDPALPPDELVGLESGGPKCPPPPVIVPPPLASSGGDRPLPPTTSPPPIVESTPPQALGGAVSLPAVVQSPNSATPLPLPPEANSVIQPSPPAPSTIPPPVGAVSQPARHLGSGRVRDGVLALGEQDWQNLTENKQHFLTSNRRRGRRRETLSVVLEKLKTELRALANHPSSVIGTIFRNIAFCLIVYFTLSEAHRVSRYDPWDYSAVPRELRIWDAVLQFTLVLDHLVCYISSTSKLNYLLRFKSIIDLCTLPLIYKIILRISGMKEGNHGLRQSASGGGGTSLVTLVAASGSDSVKSPERLLFSVIRLLRLFRLEGLLSYSIPSLEPVTLILLGLALDSWIILSVFASLMYLLEAPIHGFVRLFDYLYYAVVTMTTVGYGDFSPSTLEGRVITMAAILTAFVVLPYQVQRLLSAIHIPPNTVGYQPRGAAAVTSHGRNYILIYGKVRPRQLGIIMNELITSIPNSLNHVWVITPFPAIAFKSLVSKFLREHNIKLGVSQKYPTTEEIQIYAQNAKAVYILGDAAVGSTTTSGAAGGNLSGGSGGGSVAFSSMLISDDQRTFLRAFKIQSACWPKVPLSVQLVHGMYSGLTLELGVYNVVSLELLKLRCIAKTVSDCQGFIPLVFNWFQTPAPRGRVMSLLHQLERRKWDAGALSGGSAAHRRLGNLFSAINATPRSPAVTSTPSAVQPDDLMPEEDNFYHFFSGLRYHAYRMELPECFYGLDYSLVVRTLYRRYQVFFIGLINLEKKIYLNPIGHVLGSELSLNVTDMRAMNVDDRAMATAAALDRELEGDALSGIILATSIDTVREITHLESLNIDTATENLEKQFINQNMRSQPDLILATKTFFEDVKVTREEMALSEGTSAGGGSSPAAGSARWQGRHSSLERCSRAMSAFNTAMMGGVAQRSNLKRSSMDVLSPANKNPARNLISMDTIRSGPRLLAPPVSATGPIDEDDRRRRRQHSSSSSDSSGDSSDDEAIIKELPNATPHFIENSNFTLCCGWPKDLYAFLNALETNMKVLILSSHDAPGWGRWNRDLRNFTDLCAWIHGSPLSVEDLKNAGALLASSIVIFCDSHAFCVPGEPGLTTSIDNQTVLVRQQLHALFSRVQEYLSEHNGADEPESSTAVERQMRLKLPLIVTELQERESLDYLCDPNDNYLIGALRNVASRKELGRMLPRNDDDRGDDLEWAKEGGRIANNPNLGESLGATGGAASDFDVASALKFQLSRSQLDSSAYTVQSEFRAGKVYFRELGYGLIGFGLPISRFALDASLIEHCIDGCQSAVCDFISRVDLRNKRLQRYQWKSPLHLIALPKILHNAVFKEVFNYCFKFQSKLPIGVLRKFTSSRKSEQAPRNSSPFNLFSANSDEIVISCPAPDFRVIAGDRLYVLSPTPKHVLGMLISGAHSHVV